jgi:hypothetical protein
MSTIVTSNGGLVDSAHASSALTVARRRDRPTRGVLKAQHATRKASRTEHLGGADGTRTYNLRP